MKTIFVVLFSLVFAISSHSQTIDDYIEVSREVLNTEKKAAVAEAMQIPSEMSDEFWALYNEYNSKLYSVHSDRVKIIKDFAKNYETLTEDKADELWNGALKFQSDQLKLQKTYYKKFKKAFGSGIAARYFQVENKIEALVDAYLASEIPLIEVR